MAAEEVAEAEAGAAAAATELAVAELAAVEFAAAGSCSVVLAAGAGFPEGGVGWRRGAVPETGTGDRTA